MRGCTVAQNRGPGNISHMSSWQGGGATSVRYRLSCYVRGRKTLCVGALWLRTEDQATYHTCLAGRGEVRRARGTGSVVMSGVERLCAWVHCGSEQHEE